MNGSIIVDDKPIVEKIKLEPGNILEARGKKSFVIGVYDDGSRFLLKNGKLIIKSTTNIKSSSKGVSVKKYEDLHVSQNSDKLIKAPANTNMIQMALDGFTIMDKQ